MGYISEAWRLNELAIRAKTSKQASNELWFACEKFICGVIGSKVNGSTYRQSFDDMYQNSYFTFLAAVKNFQGTGSFISLLTSYVRSGCLDEMRRTRLKSNKNGRSDGKITFTNLEGKNGEGDEYNLAESIPDLYAEKAFSAVESGIVVDKILEEVDHLRDKKQRIVFREVIYKERPINEVGHEMGLVSSSVSIALIAACRELRRRPIIRALYAEVFGDARKTKSAVATSPYRTKSISAFHSTYSSVVEDIVISLKPLQFSSS